MKRIIILCLLLTNILTAQIYDPVSWSFKQNKISECELELIFTADIEKGWHLYSQDIKQSPPATIFNFIINEDTIVENAEELLDPIEKYDPNFEMVLRYFKRQAIFKYTVNLSEVAGEKIDGYIDFMVCDSTQCLPPTLEFFSFLISENKCKNKEILEKKEDNSKDSEILEKNEDNSTGNEISEKKEDNSTVSQSWYALFGIGLIGGFLAFFMPCTFPMIPMTVSFFTKQSKTKSEGIRNALLYGISIIIIYVIVAVGLTALIGPDIANRLGNNFYFNVGFAILLLIFGVSFLGAFDIKLPSSWTNKSVQAEQRGGYIGIFFMALTLVLVSFSCTGPLVGKVLILSASGEYLGPIFGMLGFSLAVAVPFVILALFPNLLQSLPKSGGWLNSLKVVLGLLEIAFAFYYFSKADLIDSEVFLKREMFVAIWIMIFACITFYLLGFFKFAHDSDVKHLSVTRFSLALLFGVYTIHMIPALWGAPANLMFGLEPAKQNSYSPYGVGHSYYEDNESNLLEEIEEIKLLVSSKFNLSSNGSKADISELKKNRSKLKKKRKLGPQGIQVFIDYDAGIKYAKLVNKPIMIDFTGHACVNCRQMESNVWSNQEIKKILKNEVVLISLYVDEIKELPKNQQFETTIAGKKKKVRTVGDKWMVLQANTYGTNSQPYYVFLDHNEEQLINSANYQDYGTVPLFSDWLKRGLKKFKK